MKKCLLFLTVLLCTLTALAEDYNVNTDSKLRDAIAIDGADITLTADIELTNSTLEITGNRTVTIYFSNHLLGRKLSGKPHSQGLYIINGQKTVIR